MVTQVDIDQAKLEEFMGQAITDMAAAESSALMYVGEKLGLYRALDGAGPLPARQLAERTGTHEHYVREWLNNQAAGGYVTYDPKDGTYELSNERVLVLADDSSSVFIVGDREIDEGVSRDWFDRYGVLGLGPGPTPYLAAANGGPEETFSGFVREAQIAQRC